MIQIGPNIKTPSTEKNWKILENHILPVGTLCKHIRYSLGAWAALSQSTFHCSNCCAVGSALSVLSLVSVCSSASSVPAIRSAAAHCRAISSADGTSGEMMALTQEPGKHSAFMSPANTASRVPSARAFSKHFRSCSTLSSSLWASKWTEKKAVRPRCRIPDSGCPSKQADTSLFGSLRAVSSLWTKRSLRKSTAHPIATRLARTLSFLSAICVKYLSPGKQAV